MAYQNTACTDFRPIYPSRNDVLTDDTARQIILHDQHWEDLCGPAPKAKP